VRCRGVAKRLAPDLSARIDALTPRLFPPIYMQEVEALAQLGTRILVYGAEKLMDPTWWDRQDCLMVVRCLRLLRFVGGPKALAVLASIKCLPSSSSQVTGEWLLACSELDARDLPWPFARTDAVDATNTRVADLGPLRVLSAVKRIQLSHTRVSDLNPLRELEAIEVLGLYNTYVKDLSPIAGLPNLRWLNIARTFVDDLTPVVQMRSLVSLALHHAPIHDISILKSLRSLKEIWLAPRQVPVDALEDFRMDRPDINVREGGR
jgi:hypothetical protein